MILNLPITLRSGGVPTDADTPPLITELVRLDTNATVGANLVMTRTAAGRYVYAYAQAIQGITYQYTAAATIAGATLTITKTAAIPATDDLVVSLAQAKTYLRLIDSGENDENLTALLYAAQQYVEMECDLALLPTAQSLKLHAFPGCAEVIRLPIGPLLSVGCITYEDTAGQIETLAADRYRAEPGRRYGYVAAVDNWPTARAAPLAVTVSYTAGYAEVPRLLKQAIKLIVAGWFTQAPEGWTQQEVKQTPALTRILDLYRSWSVSV